MKFLKIVAIAFAVAGVVFALSSNESPEVSPACAKMLAEGVEAYEERFNGGWYTRKMEFIENSEASKEAKMLSTMVTDAARRSPSRQEAAQTVYELCKLLGVE